MTSIKETLDHKKIRRLIWLVLTVFILSGYSLQSVAGSAYYSMVMQAYATVSSPPVILEKGNCSDADVTVYTNKTRALVTVVAINSSTTFNYVLKTVNQVLDNWTINLQVYDNSSITRLSNAAISFDYDGSSDQIIISDGNITQPEGEPCTLAGNATVNIVINDLQATESGTSYLYVHLKIQVPETSTYSLYVITFKIT